MVPPPITSGITFRIGIYTRTIAYNQQDENDPNNYYDIVFSHFVPPFIQTVDVINYY
jgi:hypothetical protein